MIVNNKPTFFNNSDFKTLQIKVIFPFKRCDEDHAMMQVLPGMLHLSTKKYPTEKEFSTELDKLYVLACFCVNSAIGDINYFSFNMAIPDSYAIDEDLFDKQFSIFSEMIYNPKVENNKFGSKELAREIESLKINMKKVMDDAVNYSIFKGKEAVDDIGVLSSSVYNHQEEIDFINEENLYNFYLEKVYNNNPIIYVFGNCDNKRVTDLCDKYLYKKKFKNYELKINNQFYLKTRDNLYEVIDSTSFRNSVISIYYKVRDMKKSDEIYLSAIKELLSSPSSRLLNKKLRDENEYVYSSFVVNYNHYGVLGIIASINKDNVDDVLCKIREVILDLKDEDTISGILDDIKMRRKIGLTRILDDKFSLFQDKINENMGVDYTASQYYEELVKISAHDISRFIDRLVLDTSYFVKEKNYE